MQDSGEYKALKTKYEVEQEYKRNHTKEYPWFIYYQFGWHSMTYLTDEECKQSVKFYHLHKDGDAFSRTGRQPIFITRRH